MLGKLWKQMMKNCDILDEASAARYQMLPKKSKFHYQKELGKLCVNENQWVKDSERKTMSESEVNERETFTYL
jgi:hypothetical protein